MAGVRQVNSRQRANKAIELHALCVWWGTIGMQVNADPLYEAVRVRANTLAEELSVARRAPTCPLFPELSDVSGVRVYVVSNKKRSRLGCLSTLATKQGIEHLYGSNRKYYVEPFNSVGRVLGGRKL